jgi:hypothetical protein
MTTTKLSATAIKTGKLPPRLLIIGREIEARAARADGYHGKAVDMVDSIKALLVEAKRYCDRGGFDAFRKAHCPSLGRSRAYEILSIAFGKKSPQQIKAAGVVRQARHIAKLKAAAGALRRADRPSVTDSIKLAPIANGGDIVRGFTTRVLELVLMTASAKPADFSAAPIEADDLRTLAALLMDIAARKSTSGKLRLVK